MHFGPYSFEASNLDKVLFPDTGLTKGELINYYVQISEYFLPHAKDRPLAMHRFPDGIEGEDFFQKNVPDYFPDWIKTISVEREEGSIRMLLANNAATLAYLANQACIAPHLFLSRADRLRHPDKLLFDLDPPEGNFELVVRAAKALRTLLEKGRGLTAFLMTTGSSGLHVVVPLRPEHSFEAVRDYARQVCEELVRQFPEDFTTEVRKEKRRERLFLDYLRNAYGQHSIAPFGVRALPGAPVAAPLYWEEIEALPLGARTFTIHTIFARLEKHGDPWKGMGRHAQKLDL